MKKRILSFALVLCMLLGLLPGGVSAAETDGAVKTQEQVQAAHADCDPEKAAVIDAASENAESRLRAAMSSADVTDVVLTGGSAWDPAVITLTAQLTVNGTKHLSVEQGSGVTLLRGSALRYAPMISVSADAHLILGDGSVSYTGDTLEESARAQEYGVSTEGGTLTLDGGAVWVQGEAFDKNTPNFKGDPSGASAVLHGNDDQPYVFSNTGLTSTAAIISSAGTLDIWGSTTLENNVKTTDFGAAIYSPSGSELNMFGGTVRKCAAAGTSDAGQGAVYVGEISLTGNEWTTKPTDKVAAFRMYGGSITNNAASGSSLVDGGGIALGKADMELYGGAVSYNLAGTQNLPGNGAGDGGGIIVGTGSVLNMYGGVVQYNHAGGYGGGIVAWNGDVNIHGGEIAFNTGAWGGGIGIAAAYGWRNTSTATSYVTMDGGEVCYNDAIQVDGRGGYGGGICAGSLSYQKGAHLTLTGGEVGYNKAVYGGGAAVYASGDGTAAANEQNTEVTMEGSFALTRNSANKAGNGMYIVAQSPSLRHTLVTLGGAACIDTSNPVYFEEIGLNEIPVLVKSRLTTAGTAAIFEFSDAFWAGAHSGYGYAAADRGVISFADGLDVQENKIALESSTWYLRANTADNTLGLRKFEESPQYTIRNGTPVKVDGKRYYRVYSALADAFEEAADGDTLYIFYNTTIDRPAVLDGKKVTILAESTSSAGVDAALSGGACAMEETDHGYYVLTGSFLKYVGGTASAGSGFPDGYRREDLSYNIRNDYTITLSSKLYLGDVEFGNKEDVTGYAPDAAAAIVVGSGAKLEIGQVTTAGMGAGSLVFDGNVSYPVEGPMFQAAGELVLHSGVTVEKHSNYSPAHPGTIEVAANGSLTVNDGVCIRDSVSPVAGAVFVDNGGAFVMNGGSIESNVGAMPRYGYSNSDGTKFADYDTAYWGLPKYYYGAGAVYNLGTFTMNGGTVQNNRGEYGAIANCGSGVIDLRSGTISGNSAVCGTSNDEYSLAISGYTDGKYPEIPKEGSIGAGSGGAVFASGGNSARVTVGSGVSLSGNAADVSGGAIAVSSSVPITEIIDSYVAVDGAYQTVVAGGTERKIPAAEPVFAALIGMRQHGVQVTVESGASLTDNGGGLFGGAISAGGEGDSLLVQENVTIKNNYAYAGGGIAALRGADVTVENEITENEAAFGGGIYVGGHKTDERQTSVTVRGRVTANEAMQAGGGIYVDCLTTDSAAEIEQEPYPIPSFPDHNDWFYSPDEPGTNGCLILDGGTVSTNRLGPDLYGVGVFNRGDVVLSAAGGTQPTLSYNDQIYLEEDHVVTLDASYSIGSSGQNSTNPLTLRSYALENGTALLQAASEQQAQEVATSAAFVHVERTVAQRQSDRSVIEINAAFVHYYTEMPEFESALGVHSTYIYAPGASDVYALNFSAAGKDQQSGAAVDRFTLPEGKNLSAWALIGYDADTETWRYIKADNSFTDSVDEALKWTPGSQIDVTENRYLTAVYVDADYYVDTEFTFTVLDPSEEERTFGTLEAQNASFDAHQKRYYFAKDTELLLTPTPVSEGDRQGVLQGMSVWHMIDAEDYVAADPENYCTTSYLTTTYYWKRDLTAEMETESYTMPEGGARTAAVTGKITGISYAPDFDDTRAAVSADGTAVRYTAPASSILVKAEFRQGMVRLDMTSESRASSFTGWYDTMHEAYEAAVEKVRAGGAGDYTFTATLLAGNTDDEAPEGYKGLACLYGDEGKTALRAVDRSGAEGNFSGTVDLNGYALDFQSLSTLNLDNMNTVIRNGLLIHHAGADGSGKNNIIEISDGTLTVENLVIRGEEETRYAVKAGMGATLTIGKNCDLGDVYLESDETNPVDTAELSNSAHVTVTDDFLNEQITDCAATLFFGRFSFPNGKRVAIILNSSVDSSTGDLIRSRFALGDGGVHEEGESTDHSKNWFIGTDGRLYTRIGAVIPRLVCNEAGEGHKTVFTEAEAEEGWPQDYPLYYTYSGVYGFSTAEHDVHLVAVVKDSEGSDLQLEVGQVTFAVTRISESGRNRVFNRVNNVSYDKAANRSTASVSLNSLSGLDANGTSDYYVISAAWTGSDQYSAQYSAYWNASGQETLADGSSGRVTGTARLDISPKPMTDESIAVGAVTPTQAEYIGPAGAASGYTSSPTRITMYDNARGVILQEESEYEVYFAALTTDPAERAADHPEAMEYRGVTYYYKDNGQGGKLYYTEGGSGDGSGLSAANAGNLNGAPAGSYSVAMTAKGGNYTGESGWKGVVFTITPYAGELRLSGPNHVVAGEDGSYQEKIAAKFRAALEADAARPLTVSDRYGNVLSLEECALRFEPIGGGAETDQSGWPAAEGLYNLVATASGHENGTMLLTDASGTDPNYAPTATGYMALLVTEGQLNIFLIPATVSEPYTGAIYTDEAVKQYDGTDYEVWTVDVDKDSGLPLDKDGNELTDPELIPAEGRNARRLEAGEYRLEIGTAQHIPQDVGTYTMIVMDTSGKYRGLGYLRITDRAIGLVEVAPATGIYTGQGHEPDVAVYDLNGNALTRGSDYILSITASDGRHVTVPVSAGVYTYSAAGINNYSGGAGTEQEYVVLPKDIANGDLDGNDKLDSVALDAESTMIRSGSLTYSVAPRFTLYYNGFTLQAGRDFAYAVTRGGETVDGIKESGRYTVTITGLGNYRGSLSYELTVLDSASLGSLTVENTGEFIYQASTFADYQWDNSAAVIWTNAAGTEFELDLGRCTVSLSRDIEGLDPVPEETVLDAGLYFVWVRPNTDYAAQLGMAEADPKGVCVFVVERRAVTVTVETATKVYGQNDPADLYTHYTTDLTAGGNSGPVSGGFYTHDTVTGSFAREEGENVRTGRYVYTLGTFAAGENYIISINQTTGLHIEPKDISVPDNGTADEITVNYQQTMPYTGYGLSPISSVVYTAERGSFSVQEKAHYQLSYSRWVPGTHEEGEVCTPADTACGGTWVAFGAVPSDVGWYSAEINASNVLTTPDNYTGTRSVVFEIRAQGGSLDLSVSGDSTVTYRAAAFTPSVAVYRSGFALPSGSYTMSYSFHPADGSDSGDRTGTFVSGVTEFTEAGEYTIYAAGTGNFAGSAGSTVFTILPKNLAEGDTADGTQPVKIALAQSSFVYNGSAQQAGILASYPAAGESLTAATDYTLAYRGHTDAGQATVIISGRGNYTGSRELTYTIEPMPVTVTVQNSEKVYGTRDPDYTYVCADSDGNPLHLTLTGRVGREPGESAGSYSLTLEGATLSAGSNYTLRLAENQFLSITKKPLGDGTSAAANISATVPQYRSVGATAGSLVTELLYWAPYLGRRALVPGADYTVTVTDENGAEMTGTLAEGTYTVTVAAAGNSDNYTGSFVSEVRIVNADALINMGNGGIRVYRVDGEDVELTPFAGNNAESGRTFPDQEVVLTAAYSNGRTMQTLRLRTDADGKLTFHLSDAGTYTLVMTAHSGAGSSVETYFGTVTYVVQPKNIQSGNTDGNGEASLDALEGDFSFTGGEVAPTNAERLLRYGGVLIPAAEGGLVNYIVGYSNNVNPGTDTAVLTVYGQGNYTGTRTVRFSIGETRYRITYNGNAGSIENGVLSGSVPVSAELYPNGESAVVQGSGSMKLRVGGEGGYDAVFLGWSETAFSLVEQRSQLNGTALYSGGSTVVMERDLTLYAVWAADRNGNGRADCDEDSASVRYSADLAGDAGLSGLVPVDSNTYIQGATVTVKGNEGSLALSGYVFLGWTDTAPESGGFRLRTSDEYIAFVTANSLYTAGRTFVMGAQDVTLYSVWGVDANGNGTEDWREQNQFFVTYDANGGAGTLPAPQILDTGVLTVNTAADPKLSRPGFVQIGWVSNRSGAGAPDAVTENDQLSEENGTVTVGGTVYVYCAFGSEYRIALDDPNPVIFYALWAADENGNGTPDYEETRLSVSYRSAAAAAKNAVVPSDSRSYLAGTEAVVLNAASAYDAEGNALAFLGWTADEAAAGSVYARGETPACVLMQPGEILTVGTENVTLFAVWGAADYHAREFRVTVYCGTGASADGAGTVIEGQDRSITITVSEGYQLTSVQVNGAAATPDDNGDGSYTLTLSNIREDKTVVVRISRSDFQASWPSNLRYTGAVQQFGGIIKVLSNGRELTYGTDYTLSPASATEAGHYTVTVEGKGAYAGKTAQTVVQIDKARLTGLTVDETAFTYDGTAKTPLITSVTAEGVTVPLEENVHYTVTYQSASNDTVYGSAPTEAGRYLIRVTGVGSVEGSQAVEFTITANDLTVDPVESAVYNGLRYRPTPTVRDGSTVLTESIDYRVAYESGCINAGSYELAVEGKGSYQGKNASVTYAVLAKDLRDTQPDSGNIAVSVADAAYDGSEKRPAVSVVYTTAEGPALQLAEGKDFTLQYSDNVMAGTGKVTITGLGNYTGVLTETFSILPAGGKSLTVTSVPDSAPYTGAEQSPAVTVSNGSTVLTAGTDYTVAFTAVSGTLGENGKPLDAGTYTVSITGLGNYAGFAGAASYVITPLALGSAEVSGTYIYDGTPQKAAVTVKNAAGDVLTEDVDYELRYSDNVNAGNALVTVVGIGNYSGVLNREYSIGQAALTVTPTVTEKVFGQTDPALHYTITGKPAAAPALNLRGELSRENGETVGEYDFTLGTLRAMSGNYTLTLADVPFTIMPKSLGDGEASAEGILETLTRDGLTVGYNGTSAVTEVVLSYDFPLLGYDIVLEAGRGYTLSFEKKTGEDSYAPAADSAVDVGEYRVTVSGMGNYTGSFRFTLTVSEAMLGLSLNGPSSVPYDGTDRRPGEDELTVLANGAELQPGQFETRYLDENGVEVDEFVNAGNYIIEVSAENYASARRSFQVTQVLLTAAHVASGPADCVYNGAQQRPSVTMVDDVERDGYSVAYGTNIDAGEGTVSVTSPATGNYYGGVTLKFAIAPFTLTTENTGVSELADAEYTASSIRQIPTVRVELNGAETLLAQDVDYVLDYSADTVNVGTVTVTVRGTGNFTGELNDVRSYRITPRRIQPEWIRVEPDELTYTGSELTPAVRVKDGEITLREGVDYELTYTANREVGTASVTVRGIGNYTGEPSAEFIIVANATSLNIAAAPAGPVRYNGRNQRPTLTVTSGTAVLGETDYTVLCRCNGAQLAADAEFRDAGLYVITVNGTGSYLGATGTVFFTITPAEFEVEDNIPDQKYTGSPVVPTLTVRSDLDGDGTLETDLVYGTDFTVTPDSNDLINPGTVTLRISGIGNYAGCERTVSYRITGDGALFGVTYDGNGSTGGTVPADTASYLAGAMVTVLGGTPERSGAVFLGWVAGTRPAGVTASREEEAAYTALYRAGAQLAMPDNGLTLYALWAKDENGNGRPDYAENPRITASAGAGGSITPDGARDYAYGTADVVYTVTPESGYSFSGLTVDGAAVAVSTAEAPTALVRNADGSLTYTFAAVTEDHVILATFEKNASGGGGGGGAAADPETPARPDWNPEIPQLETERHFAYMTGFEDGTFRPNDRLTRAQVAVILARLMNGGADRIPEGLTSAFTDVPEGAWYHDAVAYLEQYGIVNGVGDGRFEPDRAITRAEFSAMVMRYFVLEPYTGDPIFSDLDSGHWAYDLINSAHACGFVQGYTDGTFAPEQEIRRGEAAAMLNKVLQRGGDRDYLAEHADGLTAYPDVPASHWAWTDIMEASNGHGYERERDWTERWTGLES